MDPLDHPGGLRKVAYGIPSEPWTRWIILTVRVVLTHELRAQVDLRCFPLLISNLGGLKGSSVKWEPVGLRGDLAGFVGGEPVSGLALVWLLGKLSELHD